MRCSLINNNAIVVKALWCQRNRTLGDMLLQANNHFITSRIIRPRVTRCHFYTAGHSTSSIAFSVLPFTSTTSPSFILPVYPPSCMPSRWSSLLMWVPLNKCKVAGLVDPVLPVLCNHIPHAGHLADCLTPEVLS